MNVNQVNILEGHERWVMALAISPDGRRLASGSDDQTLRGWDLQEEKGKSKVLRRFDSAVTALAYSKDGNRLFVGTWDGELMVCEASSGNVLMDLDEHEETITCVTLDPSGRYLASGSADDTLILRDAETGEGLLTFHQGNEYDVTTAGFSVDGKRLVTGDGENELKIWDTETGDEIETLMGHSEPVTCAAFLPNGHLVSGSWDDTLRLWKDGNVVTLRGHEDDITALTIDSKGMRIVSASEDKTLKIWSVAEEKIVTTLHGHHDRVACVAISTDDRQIVSGSLREIRVWEMPSQTKKGSPRLR